MFTPRHPQNAVGDHCLVGTYPHLDKVAGVHGYVARGPLLHVGSYESEVRLPKWLEPAYEAWAPYVACELDLPLPFVRYSNRQGEFLNGTNKGRYPLVFKHTAWAVAERPDLARQKKVADLLDDKGYFIRLAQGYGLNTPETTFVDGLPGAVQCPEWPGDMCWVKASVGATGLDGYRCSTADEFFQAVAVLRGKNFQVQSHIVGSICSTQLWISDEGATVLMTTDQVMGGEYQNEHEGNIFPSREHKAILPVAEILGRLAWDQGFRGYCGFDLIVTADKRVYVLEMNPRLTGAHYPGALAGHLKISEWMNVLFPKIRSDLRDMERLLDHLRGQGLLWTQEHSRGVIPTFFGAMPEGKTFLLIPGSRDEQQGFLSAARQACC